MPRAIAQALTLRANGLACGMEQFHRNLSLRVRIAPKATASDGVQERDSQPFRRTIRVGTVGLLRRALPLDLGRAVDEGEHWPALP